MAAVIAREGDFIGIFANKITNESFRIGIFIDDVRIAIIYTKGLGHDIKLLNFLIDDYNQSNQFNLNKIQNHSITLLNFKSIQYLDDAYEIYDFNLYDLPKKLTIRELKPLQFLHIMSKNFVNFEKFQKGDILKFNGLNVFRKFSLYHHHAIFADEDRFKLIHKARDPEKSLSTATKSVVQETNLFDFCYYRVVDVDNHYDSRYKTNNPDAIVSIARNHLDQKGFNIITDNCQHFASECRYNKHKSHEVRKMAVVTGVLVGGTSVATAAVLAHHFRKKKEKHFNSTLV